MVSGRLPADYAGLEAALSASGVQIQHCLTEGRRNATIQLQTSTGVQWILKLYLGSGARQRARAESAGLEAARQRGIRVPVVVMDGTRAPDESPFLVTAKVGGLSLEAGLARLVGEMPLALPRDLGALAGQCSAVGYDWFGSLSGEPPRFETWSDCVIHRLEGGLSECVSLGVVDWTFVNRCLDAVSHRRHLLECRQASLVHGDFVPANIICAEGVNLADAHLIDFEVALAGCSAMELVQVRRNIGARYSGFEADFVDRFTKSMRCSCAPYDPEVHWVYEMLEMVDFWTWGVDAGLSRQVEDGIDSIETFLSGHA